VHGKQICACSDECAFNNASVLSLSLSTTDSEIKLTENRYYVTQQVQRVGAAMLATEETRVGEIIGVYIRGIIMISFACI